MTDFALQAATRFLLLALTAVLVAATRFALGGSL